MDPRGRLAVRIGIFLVHIFKITWFGNVVRVGSISNSNQTEPDREIFEPNRTTITPRIKAKLAMQEKVGGTKMVIKNESEQVKGGEVVTLVNPKPNRGLITSKAIDFLEKLAVMLMYNSSKQLHYLSGNFSPVTDETPPATNTIVTGLLPVSAFLTLC